MECARAAAAATGARADVVVFEDDRAFVVASSADNVVLFPRPLMPAEQDLLSAGTEQRTGSALVCKQGDVAVPILDGENLIVGSLSIHDAGGGTFDVLFPLARLIMGELISQPDREDSFFHEIVEAQRDAIILLGPDLTIKWASRGISTLIGRTPAEITGRSAADFIHPDDLETALDAITRMSQGLEVWRVAVRLSAAAGDWNPVEVTGTDHSGDAVLGGLVLSLRDAQQDRELKVAVSHSRRTAASIVAGLHEGIVATDQFGAVTLANEIARSMFGVDPALSSAQLSLADFALVNADGQPHELLTTGEHNGEVCCVVSIDGEIRYVTTTNQPIEGDAAEPLGTVIVFHDITNEWLAAEELRQQALHDQLTGLANRRLLDKRMAELASLAPAITVAACFIDLDGFKMINDNHGHRAGDELIRIAADRLEDVVRKGDLLVRQGGDEFVALLVDTQDIEAAAMTAERYRAALSEPYVIGDDRFDLTASVGVAVGSSRDLADERLFQHADLALYAAKNRGRNRVESFNSSLAEAVRIEERQRRLLRDALDDDRLVMHFQPLLDVETECTKGFEALARIVTADGELVGPSAFMEAIANSSLMWDLDRAAFRLSCQAAALLARLSPERPPYMACNFSSVSLTHPDFIGFLIETVDRAAVDPRQIVLEVTEGAAFDPGSGGASALHRLHDHGFKLALDDFGTGYSSLSHLRDLPISIVKVDQSFIARLANHDSERAIAQAVVSLCRDLALNVVAEGVENAAQLDQVRQLGFETIQGWHYSTAVPLAGCLQNWKETTTRVSGR